MVFTFSNSTIFYCNFFIAAATAELSSWFPLFFFSLEYERLPCSLELLILWSFWLFLDYNMVIFYLAFWIDVDNILSTFALFYAADFCYLWCMMDWTKLYCSARFRYIYFHFYWFCIQILRYLTDYNIIYLSIKQILKQDSNLEIYGIIYFIYYLYKSSRIS